MEKIGSNETLLIRMALSWETHQDLANSKEAQAHNESLAMELETLKSIRSERDIVTILSCEHAFLHQELKNYANSPEEVNSIKVALKQMGEAEKSLRVVRDPQGYQAATETYSGKQMEAGLPLDSFRQFLKSHSARLGNRMAAPLSVPEKNILRQRKENMSMVKELYVEMQRAALGIEAPTKSKGLGR